MMTTSNFPKDRTIYGEQQRFRLKATKLGTVGVGYRAEAGGAP
jgi:hypothetical protein